MANLGHPMRYNGLRPLIGRGAATFAAVWVRGRRRRGDAPCRRAHPARARSLNATYGGLWTSEPFAVGHDDWECAWVATDSEQIVRVGLSERDVVSDLWVHPYAQGKGAGSALLFPDNFPVSRNSPSAVHLEPRPVGKVTLCLRAQREGAEFRRNRRISEMRRARRRPEVGARSREWLRNLGVDSGAYERRRLLGRSGRIRTCDPRVPNTVLYQTELHSDLGAAL